MAANPFGREAMKQCAKSAVTLRRGENSRLRYGAVIHDGLAASAQALEEFFRNEIGNVRLEANALA
jgi:hypothetical protein